jgi:hypothetical protein
MNAILRYIDPTLIVGLLVAFFLILLCRRWVWIYVVGKWRAYKRGYSITTANLFFMKSEGCFDEGFFDGLKLLKEKGYMAPIYDLCVSYKVDGFSFEEMVDTMDFVKAHNLKVSLRQVLMVQRQKLGKTLPLVQRCADYFPVKFEVEYPNATLSFSAKARFVFPNVAYTTETPKEVEVRMKEYAKAFVPEKNKDFTIAYWNRYYSAATVLEQFAVELTDVCANWEIKQ